MRRFVSVVVAENIYPCVPVTKAEFMRSLLLRSCRSTQRGRDRCPSHASLLYVGITGRMHRSCWSWLRIQFIWGNYAQDYYLFDSYGRG